MIAHLVDRINCYECFRIGLTDKIHQLSVLVLIYNGDYLFAGRIIVCTDNFIKGCSAVEVMKDKINDLVKLKKIAAAANAAPKVITAKSFTL